LTPERLRTSDFEYHLPTELIAQHPLPERGGSRLLVVRRDATKSGACLPFIDARFSDLPTLIPAGDLVVLNTTRVRHARLLGTRPSGAPAEVLLVQPANQDVWLGN
jgi:S-adenosylmethionine:tRNA ribosyltransferase-isomerase